MRLIQRLVILLGCVQLLGGVYAPLQLIAWGTMLARYAGDDGLAVAARVTFDGSRPCPMCLAISQAKQADGGKSELPAKPLEKLKLSWLEGWLSGTWELPEVLVAGESRSWYGLTQVLPPEASGEPAVPPPRMACA